MSGKRIGFVDLKLDNFHANTYEELVRGSLKGRGFEITGCWAKDAEGGKAWSAKHKVPYANSLADLNALADVFMVLAPSNPEAHLEMVRSLVGFKKPIWVDKTFAPDFKIAREIFALADAALIPLETSSALRYTPVQARVKALGRDTLRHVVTWGGGGSYEEYVVHPVELAVSCLGGEAVAVMRRGEGEQRQLLVDFSRGRTAVINVYPRTETSFAASLTTDKATEYVDAESADLFKDAMNAVLNFFDAGTATFDRAETLAIFKIIDAARQADAGLKMVKLAD